MLDRHSPIMASCVDWPAATATATPRHTCVMQRRPARSIGSCEKQQLRRSKCLEALESATQAHKRT